MAAAKKGKGRRVTMDIRLIPGVCFVCGCTDDFGCDEGCSWSDEGHSLCSACERRGMLFLEWIVAAGRVEAPAEIPAGRCSAVVDGGRCAGLEGHDGEHYANARDRKAVR